MNVLEELTDKEKIFVKDNCIKLTSEEMAEALGVRIGAIYRYMKRYRLKDNKGVYDYWRRNRDLNNKEMSLYDRKLRFSLNSGYDSVGEAIGAMGKYNFERRFNRSKY